MKSLWISSFLCFSVLIPLAAQDNRPDQPPPEAADKQAFALGQELAEVIGQLRAFQPEEAHQTLKTTRLPDGLRHMLEGWAYHQKGDYKQASRAFALVDKNELGNDPYFLNRFEELSKTAEELAHFSVFETQNFSFRYQEGPDKVMLFFLPELLEEVYARYAELFHYARDEKIIVELMPDHRLFSYASALTRTQIETTGTIALCVENRLVVLTPRRVLQGYYWPDVIAHEFVHYILTKQSSDNVPLWMQEGVAKYFEARWESDEVNPIDPALETSLAQAIVNDSLITVEEMKPSFAALPTAALARQAYAQTTSMVDYICALKGEDVVHRLVVSLKDTPDMDSVMQTHLGKSFDQFEEHWRDWIKEQGYQDHGARPAQGVTLLDEDGTGEAIVDVEARGKAQKKFMRLGDLLLERNRYEGALKQYRKSLDHIKTGHVGRQTVLRMLLCLENLSNHQEIIELIDTHIPDPRNDVTMLVYKARAHLGLDQTARAELLLDRAVKINPFNPEIYQVLQVLERETGDKAALTRLQEILAALETPTQSASKDSKS